MLRLRDVQVQQPHPLVLVRRTFDPVQPQPAHLTGLPAPVTQAHPLLTRQSSDTPHRALLRPVLPHRELYADPVIRYGILGQRIPCREHPRELNVRHPANLRIPSGRPEAGRAGRKDPAHPMRRYCGRWSAAVSPAPAGRTPAPPRRISLAC
ncbi:hypothetical protein A0H81_10551 [Grifola frondosa]|uniref:Uncharacterized protein n=1 Tax=Grifola frondosa TaxID=5627 RepID=A0A1C7LXP5_GRIFR|nr:hypothetical protein A0H81_10551 [Grifola frondosa]